MKRTFTFLFSLLILNVRCQVFTGSGGPIANNSGFETVFPLNVSSLPALIDSVYGLEEVCLSISHPDVEELHVSLRSPSGLVVELSGMKSCKGGDFQNTCFNNSQPVSITVGAAPYTGGYKPLGNLGRFNRQLPGNGTWELIVKDYVGGANSGTLTSWSLRFGSAPAVPVILTSSNLPLVHINTPSAQPLTESAILVSVKVTDNGPARNYFSDPGNNYTGNAQCYVRGHSSTLFEKHNLKLELKDHTGLADTIAAILGMPAESDWILTACYTDKTMIRNTLAQEIFVKMGHYSPRYRYVELILNGEYFGVYLVMEQIKRGKDRVNIDKIEPVDNQFPSVTGGYILQIDRYDEPGWYSLYPGVSANGAKFLYQYNYPRPDVITDAQKNYIKAVLDSFEIAMASPSFSDPVSGYEKFIHVNSFIDYLILNEVSKNVDAYKLSSYLFKENVLKGGKLHAGPAWDYDLAWHNANFGNAFSETLWQFEHNNSANPIPSWWRRFMEDPAFKDKLFCRYSELRQSILSVAELNKYIDQTATLLTEARARNYKQFPIIGAYVYANPQSQVGATYGTELADLKSWIVNRTDWLDVNITGFCQPAIVEERSNMKNAISVFPNPFNNTITIVFNAEQVADNMSIDLYAVSGERVFSTKQYLKMNEFHLDVEDTRKVPAGIYFLKLSVDNQPYFCKILKATGD